MTTLYGIKNCDSVKKARKWLQEHNIDYTFHDFRVDGLMADTLERWCKNVGWEILLNRRGTSWRQLPAEVKENIDEASAREQILLNPTLVKRPVLESGNTVLVGFQAERYTQLFL